MLLKVERSILLLTSQVLHSDSFEGNTGTMCAIPHMLLMFTTVKSFPGLQRPRRTVTSP